jgi:hypothetical protein
MKFMSMLKMFKMEKKVPVAFQNLEIGETWTECPKYVYEETQLRSYEKSNGVDAEIHNYNAELR